MLNLSIRQIKILDHLLQNEVSHIDDLFGPLNFCRVSEK